MLDGFIHFIGPRRAAASIGSVTTTEIESFRNQQILDGKTASTANLAVSVLRAVLGSARRVGIKLSNPADAVKPQDSSESEERLPFNADQTRDLLGAANHEWRGMILFGYDTRGPRGPRVDLTPRSSILLPRSIHRPSHPSAAISLHPRES